MSKLIEMLKNPPVRKETVELFGKTCLDGVILTDYEKWAKQIQRALVRICFDGDMKELIRDFCTGDKP